MSLSFSEYPTLPKACPFCFELLPNSTGIIRVGRRTLCRTCAEQALLALVSELGYADQNMSVRAMVRGINIMRGLLD